MATAPTVSVHVAVYNAEPTLSRALDSVLSQTRPVEEVVIVNDGSTDRSAEVIESYAARSPGLFKVLTQANCGVSVARNVGIEAAQGEFIAFLDADDWWEPDKLEVQMAVMCDSGTSVSFTAFTEWRGGIAYPSSPVESWPATSDGALRRLLLGNPIIPTTVIAQRESLVAAGMFDPSVSGAQDYEAWLRLAALGNRFGYVSSALAHYDRLETSITAAVHAAGADVHMPALRSIFGSGVLPVELQRRERTYYSHACLNHASGQLRAHRNRAALLAISKAFVYSPTASRPGWLGIAAKSLAGMVADRVRSSRWDDGTS